MITKKQIEKAFVEAGKTAKNWNIKYTCVHYWRNSVGGNTVDINKVRWQRWENG